MLKRPLPQLTGSTGWWGVPFAAKAASLPSSGDPWKLKAVDLSKSFFVGFVCLLGKKRKVPFSHKLPPHARTHARTHTHPCRGPGHHFSWEIPFFLFPFSEDWFSEVQAEARVLSGRWVDKGLGHVIRACPLVCEEVSLIRVLI